MSDDDFMFDEEEEYDFEYEEDDGDEETVGIETKYYNAKAQRENVATALQEFQQVIYEDNAGERGEWGFKATKQTIKLHLQARDFDKVLEFYGQMLDYVRKSA
ncbi:COP9 signalosome complex subunit 2, partial [Coemansia sp. RSA 2618]